MTSVKDVPMHSFINDQGEDVKIGIQLLNLLFRRGYFTKLPNLYMTKNFAMVECISSRGWDTLLYLFRIPKYVVPSNEKQEHPPVET